MQVDRTFYILLNIVLTSGFKECYEGPCWCYFQYVSGVNGTLEHLVMDHYLHLDTNKQTFSFMYWFYVSSDILI